jgi:2-haloacid dehalogenase
MEQANDLRASINVCMFDQYGTVVDMQTGLTEAAAPFLAAKGWQGDLNSSLHGGVEPISRIR